MKRLGVIFYCILICNCAQGQRNTVPLASISLDIPSVITSGSIRIDFSHSFSGHWSADGGVSVQAFQAFISDEERLTIEDLCPEFRLGFKYWPKGYYKGAYIGIGCSCEMKGKPDMNVNVGYTMHICRHIGLHLGYESKIIESIKDGLLIPRNMVAGVNYIF